MNENTVSCQKLRVDPGIYSMLGTLIERAAYANGTPKALGLVYPRDNQSMHAARQLLSCAIATPVMVGPRAMIEKAADAAGVSVADIQILDTPGGPAEAALRSMTLAREGTFSALMKGSVHTDELMSVFLSRNAGMRVVGTRISHLALYELPRNGKLLGLTDCAINVAPSLEEKRDILANAINLLKKLGISRPKVAILAAVETVNPAIQATVDAQALVDMAAANAWPGAQVEGPFGFDNAFSAEAARMKNLSSSVCGDADLLLVPDLNAGNMLHKSFKYVGGGESAGLVLGGRVPLVVTSRSDSALSRVASAALAMLSLRDS